MQSSAADAKIVNSKPDAHNDDIESKCRECAWLYEVTTGWFVCEKGSSHFPKAFRCLQFAQKEVMED